MVKLFQIVLAIGAVGFFTFLSAGAIKLIYWAFRAVRQNGIMDWNMLIVASVIFFLFLIIVGMVGIAYYQVVNHE